MSGEIIKLDGNLIANDYQISAFESLLQNHSCSCEIDLSTATLIEVINAMTQLKKLLSPNYGKKYSSLLYHLNRLQSRFKCILMPYQINDLFWYNFVPYLVNEGLAISTIKTMCAQLRSALHWGALHHAKISPTFDCIKLPSYSHQQIALTADEVSHIYHFDLRLIDKRKQYIKHIDRVRYMFVLSCNLGQRYSDMIRIDPSCFERNIFRIVQQKTGTQARVDIDRMSIDPATTYAILNKYNWNAPLRTDISAFDRYLKQLLKYIGFNQNIKRQIKVNGYIKVYEKEKWRLVTSHTGRRTFATINVLRGHHLYEVRRATGHLSESAFEKYLCYFDN